LLDRHRKNGRRLADFTIRQTGWTAAESRAFAVGNFRIILLVGEAMALPGTKQRLKQEEKFPRLCKAFSANGGLIEPMKVSLRFLAQRRGRFASPKHAADLPAGGGWDLEQIDPAQALFDRLLAELHQDLKQQTVALDLPR